MVLLLLPCKAQAAEAITAKEQLNREGITIGTDVGNVAEVAVHEELFWSVVAEVRLRPA